MLEPEQLDSTPRLELNQAVVLTIGSTAVPLTAFETLAEVSATRDMGDPSETDQPTSLPNLDPDDTDFYGL